MVIEVDEQPLHAARTLVQLVDARSEQEPDGLRDVGERDDCAATASVSCTCQETTTARRASVPVAILAYSRWTAASQRAIRSDMARIEWWSSLLRWYALSNRSFSSVSCRTSGSVSPTSAVALARYRSENSHGLRAYAAMNASSVCASQHRSRVSEGRGRSEGRRHARSKEGAVCACTRACWAASCCRRGRHTARRRV